MMALGALEPHAHEDLGGRLGQVVGVAGDPEVVGRPVAEDRPLRGHQLVDHPVDRHVGAERLAKPEVERQHPLRTQLLGVDAEQIAPLQRPVIDVLRAIEQAIDQLGPLVGIVVGQEVLDLVGRGRGADGVEHRAAQELGVGARRRRDQPQLAPLGGGLDVDDVAGPGSRNGLSRGRTGP